MRMDFALLIIDVLVDFFERVPELSAQRARLVAATNQLTEAVRGAGQPVIWVRQEFRPDLSDTFLDILKNYTWTFAESACCKTMISFIVSVCQGKSSPNLLRPEFGLLPRHEIHAANCAPEKAESEFSAR